ncbi:hypothetical protein B296_00045791, partial [Ensete ventricosum]
MVKCDGMVSDGEDKGLMYERPGFRKVDPDRWEFAHESFLRGQAHLLPSITRRRRKREGVLHESSSRGRGGVGGEEERLLLRELEKLRQQQRTLEEEVKAMSKRLQATERSPRQLMSFLVKVAEDPKFLLQGGLVRSKQQLLFAEKKRRLFTYPATTLLPFDEVSAMLKPLRTEPKPLEMKERIPSDGAEELVKLGFRLGLHADDDDEGDEAVVFGLLGLDLRLHLSGPDWSVGPRSTFIYNGRRRASLIGYSSHFTVSFHWSGSDPSNARDQLSKGGKKRGEESGAEMGGGMEVNKNKYIEDWNAARENLELNFRWTRRNLAIVGIFGLAVPILVYKGIVREFRIKKCLNRFPAGNCTWFCRHVLEPDAVATQPHVAASFRSSSDQPHVAASFCSSSDQPHVAASFRSSSDQPYVATSFLAASNSSSARTFLVSSADAAARYSADASAQSSACDSAHAAASVEPHPSPGVSSAAGASSLAPRVAVASS